MAIFEVREGDLARLQRANLASARIHERADLQRLLRVQLPELLPDLLVIAEEFGDWEDSRRRIDLLAVDRDANLVVIELKRGDTGVHMELQAIRYAAMVSTMTFDLAVDAYASHLAALGSEGDPRQMLLEFLGWTDPGDGEFAPDVHIVLFSEDYSRELTTAVLWLNNHDVNIRAFRMQGYALDGRLLLDFQQIIPLKEAEEYQVRVRKKQQIEQAERRPRVPWNGEYYANFGVHSTRSWEDARRYGFISAGGSPWFTRTLNLLEPGARVWVNRPGVGYVGVGIVESGPQSTREFRVQTDKGMRPYLEVAEVRAGLEEWLAKPGLEEQFVKVRWLVTRPDSEAVRGGLFGNQNSVAKPTTEAWTTTVDKLKAAFGIDD